MKELFQDKFKEEIKITFAYEEADVYYKEIMPEKWRERWREVWVEHGARGKAFITDYATRNEKEGFAEYAGYFETKPQVVLENSKEIYNFMKEFYISIKK